MARTRPLKFFGCSCCNAPVAVPAPTGSDRRSLLTGALATLGLAAAGDFSVAPAQAQANPRRIDIHHHLAPPAWLDYVKGRELLQPANVAWTPAKSIEDMDKGGVAMAMLSVTNPGLYFGDNAATTRVA